MRLRNGQVKNSTCPADDLQPADYGIDHRHHRGLLLPAIGHPTTRKEKTKKQLF